MEVLFTRAVNLGLLEDLRTRRAQLSSRAEEDLLDQRCFSSREVLPEHSSWGDGGEGNAFAIFDKTVHAHNPASFSPAALEKRPIGRVWKQETTGPKKTYVWRNAN